MSDRESITFDVVIVGAGPSGLSAAIRLAQLSQANQLDLSICVVEKGSEVGAHILSGAIVDPSAIEELFSDWQTLDSPLDTEVTEDQVYLLLDQKRSRKIPDYLLPNTLSNQGNYVVSVGNLCRWLASHAEALGVEIFPGFAASETLYGDAGEVLGVRTGDMGRSADGNPKSGYMAGMDLLAKYTVFAEGCRGHLGKEILQHYKLDEGCGPQHYAIGFKELWDIPPEQHKPGLVIHGGGWPLTGGSHGGFYLYHAQGSQLVVGLIVDLDYKNPWLSPYEEFQRLKLHPLIAEHLQQGQRISYGARAIAKGGYNALPTMHFPGGFLIGCDAGTLNVSKIKGTHTAMKSGMLTAEEICSAISKGDSGGSDLAGFDDRFRSSWLYKELYYSRNFGPAIHRFGNLIGGAFNTIEQNLFAGRLPLTIKDNGIDHLQLVPASKCTKIDYPKPDGVLSFDRLSSVNLANIDHDDDQPCHLQMQDPTRAIELNLPRFAEPAQRYCPAGVYEIVEANEGAYLQINSQNCIHCKTCDIKDPSQNIVWLPPEGGSGPNYPNM
jgi:electron-transferring-flavoprotein dehydrogenase